MPPQSIIRRNPPDAVVYDLSTPGQVTITLPAGSTWTSGLHWHETHTEYLQLIKGRIRLRLGDTVRTVSATLEPGYSLPEIQVDKNVWHEWSRAEAGTQAQAEEEVIVVERTDPADGDKAIFFWNLNGVILEAQRATMPSFIPRWLREAWTGLWVPLSLFAIFDALDNFPVFLGIRDTGWQRGFIKRGSWGDSRLSWLEVQSTHAILSIASLLIWIVGGRAIRPRFTPAEEYAAWVLRNRGSKSQ
ncbi:hypothetical protein C7999DRAFT_33575 [Corynascus novoguineensis]|uniref:Uncharacterized protein n=1 Tax=Corynascus novoguineensis TaxID=1126955 RepID=A0AAN7HLP9_9PEZI|nr:hypothetical protein C7999DRAFT_33575 [Corynascus novoguineensis]